MNRLEKVQSVLEKMFGKAESGYGSNYGLRIKVSKHYSKKNVIVGEVTCMYEKPQFVGQESFLTALVALRDAVGAKDLDLPDSISNSGCETCDYGSSYGYEFEFSF